MPLSAASPWTRWSRASTEGSERSADCRASDLPDLAIELSGHPLPHPGDHRGGLLSHRLEGPPPVRRAPEAADGLLDQPGPQLLQILRGEPLAAERVGPLARQGFHEAVALARQAAGPANQRGQAGAVVDAEPR